MRFRQDKVKDLARQIVEMLHEHPDISLESEDNAVRVAVGSAILDNLKEEDDIDAEVDELLDQHASAIDTQEMNVADLRIKFRTQIAKERGFIL